MTQPPHDGWGQPPRLDTGGYPQGNPPPEKRSLGVIVGAVAAVLVLVVGGTVGVIMLRGDGDPDDIADGPTASQPTDATPTESTRTDATPTETTPIETTGATPAGDTAYCVKLGILNLRYLNFDVNAITDDDLSEMISGLTELKPLAPREMKDEYTVFLGGLSGLRGILDEVGLRMEDLLDPQALREVGPTITETQRLRLNRVVNKLNSERFQTAGPAIDEDFETRCT